MEGFYYDPSLLFDDDGRVYIAHGNREIRITELLPDLSAPLPGGLDRVALQDSADIMLGYEGSLSIRSTGNTICLTFLGPWKKPDRVLSSPPIR